MLRGTLIISKVIVIYFKFTVITSLQGLILSNYYSTHVCILYMYLAEWHTEHSMVIWLFGLMINLMWYSGQNFGEGYGTPRCGSLLCQGSLACDLGILYIHSA